MDSEQKIEDFFWKLLNNQKCKLDLSEDDYKLRICSSIEEAEEFLEEESNFSVDKGITGNLNSRFLASLSEGKYYEFKEEEHLNNKVLPLFSSTKRYYIWNTQANKNNFDTDSNLNEVGSVFTTQGKSLEYSAYVMGDEVYLKNNEIHFDTKAYSKYRAASHLFKLLSQDQKEDMVVTLIMFYWPERKRVWLFV